MSKKLLILGSRGMLGQELMKLFASDSQYTVRAWDREEVDMTDFVAFGAQLDAEQPDIVINAAAYNAVDACEKDDAEYAKALALNRDLPDFLAKKSVEQGFVLVHYSTDYVFDGTLEESPTRSGCCGGGCCGNQKSSDSNTKLGYDESALPHPLSRYGESKYAGERAVREHAKQYYLIRLSKLFGKAGVSPQAKRSFFEIMLEAGQNKSEVQVVDSEKSCFTYAPDLAQATKDLIESGDQWGTYHLPNSGGVTWYQAVQELYRQVGLKTPIIPVGSEAFPRPAQRPRYSVLLNTKRPPLRPYQEALREFLQEK